MNSGRDGAPPGSIAEPLPNASLGRRLAALTYEALLLTALTLIVGFLTVPLTPHSPGGPRTPAMPDTPGRLLSACLVIAAAAAYFTWSWSNGRRTLPMKTWGVKLERRDGHGVDAKTALARYLAAWIGPAVALLAYSALQQLSLGAHAIWLVALNFLWAFVDPGRQFLHDRIAGTRIVRTLDR